MAGQIHTFTFLTLKGAPAGIVQQSQNTSRPGVDGTSTRFTGARGKEYVMESLESAASEVAANALEAAYENIVNDGNTYTVTTETNGVHNNVEVKAVEGFVVQATVGATDGSTHVARALWRLLRKV